MLKLRAIQSVWLLGDILTFLVSTFLACYFIDRSPTLVSAQLIAIMIAMRIFLFIRLGMYRSVLRYTGIHTLMTICLVVGFGSAFMVSTTFFFENYSLGGLGRGYVVLEMLLSMAFAGGSRLMARNVYNRYSKEGKESGRRVLIYGAGSLGEIALRSLRRAGFKVVGFVDDNKELHRSLINGYKVLGGNDQLAQIVDSKKVDLIALAVRDIPQERLNELFHQAMDLGLPLKVVKGIDDGVRSIGSLPLESVPLEDLLRRPPRNLDDTLVKEMLADKVVMITGAGGSIGSEISRQVAKYKAKKVCLVDQCEYNLYKIDMAIREEFPNLEVVPLLVDVSHEENCDKIVGDHKPQVIFHAAAYKHVPLVEANPDEGVRNNVHGTYYMVQAAERHKADRFVLISTDKAVRPTSIMGASKRACEIVLQSYSAEHCKMCLVRFGNVLGSSGSVIPRFLEQIKQGGPVTVTDERMTRYFMLIPEAVELVLHAGSIAKGKEAFILDMGKSIKIADMAKQLIYLTGNVPNKDIEIVYTGIRQGEKLFEELLIDSEDYSTDIGGLYIESDKSEVIEVFDEMGAIVAMRKLRSKIDGLIC